LRRLVWGTSAGAIVAAIAVLAAIQFSTPNLVGNDAYFHIRYADVIRRHGLANFPPPFPWLPLTILAPDRFADHHALYHLFLVPFTYFDLLLGAKLAALVSGGALLAAFLWFLRRAGAELAAIWVLFLFASSADFLFRLSMTRVQALSIGFLLVALELARAGKLLWLFPTALLYTLLYDGFPMLLAVVAIVSVARLATERRIDLRPLLVSLAGVASGCLLHPNSTDYLTFIYHHFGDKLIDREPLRIGREWFPYSPAGMVANMSACMVFMAIASTRLQEEPQRRDARSLAAGAVALLFFVLTLRSRRFIEYLAPFATIFLATTSLDFPSRPLPMLGRRVLFGLLVAVAVANVSGVIWTLGKKKSDPYDRYAEVARYVAENAPAGAMLCSTDWDDFPWLYFYNTKSTYLVGLDPTYFRDRDRELYWLWVEISAGGVSPPSEPLSTRFPCEYIMSDRLHADFLRVAALDPGLEQVLANEHAVLYRVLRRREGERSEKK